jgi:hypothetical protein
MGRAALSRDEKDTPATGADVLAARHAARAERMAADLAGAAGLFRHVMVNHQLLRPHVKALGVRPPRLLRFGPIPNRAAKGPSPSSPKLP